MMPVDQFSGLVEEAGAQALAVRTLEWTLSSAADLEDILGQRLLPYCTVAAVFGSICSPSNASDRQLDTAARLIVLFLGIDALDQSEFPDDPDSSLWTVGPFTKALRLWLDEFAELKEVTEVDRDRFKTAFHQYLRGRKEEPVHRADFVTMQEHRVSRRNTIFLRPWVFHWYISIKADLCSLDRVAVETLIVHTTDLVWLANDIGSWQRPADDEGEDLSILKTIRRSRGYGETQALNHAIEAYNETAKSFEALANDMLRVGSRTAEVFVDLLALNVDENIRSMEGLPFRYPSQAAFPRLRRVRDKLDFQDQVSARVDSNP